MSAATQEEEELPLNHTGPKGVINDWRRFKLDSVDQTVPQKKKELLRQMSNPREDDKERANRKMGAQEYELIKDEDERCLKRYRKQCMQEMHERLSFGPRFECVHELESGEAFLEVIEREHRMTLVVVHIYQHGVNGCEQMNSSLECLAAEYPTVKFCRIDAVASGAAERFSSEVLPTLLVYKAGELLGNFLAVTKHLNEEFFATDVEAFLNEYGLLPEKEFTACADDEDDGADVE
ncbi:phosducin a [Nothobranchius furzeri]|uniref:Phosducin n=1 Tax=Nothobranchius furzeri TaxID=105023 RepID=A0A1A7ZS90_NOTFU|nr:phosducin a [Nothobranchius furzeri]KAF7222817.1 phosducin-like [Nothobranchius furzeri]